MEMRPEQRTSAAEARRTGKRTAARPKPAKRAATPPQDEDGRSVVNSLAKGLRVLEAFSSERPELTLSEVAVLAKLDPGTAFRMLNTLVMLGYVSRVDDSRRFKLTLKVTDLGFHAIARADLREIARPILRSLVGEISEAASLGVLEGGDVLYVERVRAGLTRMGVDIRIGTTIPAPYSMIGQAMLAYLAPEHVARVAATAPRPGEFSAGPLNKAELKRILAEVHVNGFALSDSYFGSGLRVLAVPVLDIDGYPLAAVSVAAPMVRTSMQEFRARALEPVRVAATSIGKAIQVSGTITAAI
jgi:IclR family pca regulon transcriptional regulator